MSLSQTQTFQSQYLSNPYGVNLLYFKLRLFNLTEFIVLNVKVYSIEEQIIVCGKDSIPLSAYEFILLFFLTWLECYLWLVPSSFVLWSAYFSSQKKTFLENHFLFYTKRFPMLFLLIFIPFKYESFLGKYVYFGRL